jgi:segregation and condensation protein A
MHSPISNLNHPLGAAYPVTLPIFQGPLDLLLQLIEREEMAISEISLVAVTDQYLQTIAQLVEHEPGALADFLVVASKLLYIKSRALLPLPRPQVEGEEEDASDALIQQLLEYRQFKAVAASLQEREELGLRSYTRLAPLPVLEKQLDLSGVDVARLHALLRRVLQRMPSEPPVPQVKTYPITVAEQIEVVREQLRGAHRAPGGEGRVAFVELLGRQATRLEVLVTFLAVLELIKQQEVVAVQDELFGEIGLVPVMLEERTR